MKTIVLMLFTAFILALSVNADSLNLDTQISDKVVCEQLTVANDISNSSNVSDVVNTSYKQMIFIKLESLPSYSHNNVSTLNKGTSVYTTIAVTNSRKSHIDLTVLDFKG